MDNKKVSGRILVRSVSFCTRIVGILVKVCRLFVRSVYTDTTSLRSSRVQYLANLDLLFRYCYLAYCASFMYECVHVCVTKPSSSVTAASSSVREPFNSSEYCCLVIKPTIYGTVNFFLFLVMRCCEFVDGNQGLDCFFVSFFVFVDFTMLTERTFLLNKIIYKLFSLNENKSNKLKCIL